MNAPPALPARARWQVAKIVSIRHATPRIASVMLDASLQDHLAGQHLDVRLTADDGYQAQRSYSICTPPGERPVELAIERLDDGEVSPYFHEVARPGDTIEVRGPIGGHFVWRAEDGGPFLMMAGGSGIAPLIAMARERTARASTTPTLLVYSARTWEDMIYREALIAMQSADPAFRFVAVTTRGQPQRTGDFSRRLDHSLVRDLLSGWGYVPALTYVCGSNRFVEGVTRALVAANLPAATIRTERYGGTN